MINTNFPRTIQYLLWGERKFMSDLHPAYPNNVIFYIKLMANFSLSTLVLIHKRCIIYEVEYYFLKFT